MKNFSVVALLALAGCYGPKVADGALPCSTVGEQCPSGLVCAANRFCYHPSTVGQSLFGTGLTGDLDLTNKGASILLNTENGSVSIENGAVLLDHPAGFQNLPQPSGGPSVGMWNFGNLTIPAGTVVKPTLSSNSAIVLLATGKIQLDGEVNCDGFGGFFGISDQPGSPGPGAPGMSGGQPGANGSGGGGGGYGTDGKMGSAGTGGASGGVGGGGFGTDALAPLYFGAGGGGGGGLAGDTLAGAGGSGGGALAIVGQQVTLNGKLSANGANGAPSTEGGGGGGGGGAGGSVLIVSPTLMFGSSSSVFAVGGAGDTTSAAPGGDGGDGRVTIYGMGQPGVSKPEAKDAMPLPPMFPR